MNLAYPETPNQRDSVPPPLPNQDFLPFSSLLPSSCMEASPVPCKAPLLTWVSRKLEPPWGPWGFAGNGPAYPEDRSRRLVFSRPDSNRGTNSADEGISSSRCTRSLSSPLGGSQFSPERGPIGEYMGERVSSFEEGALTLLPFFSPPFWPYATLARGTTSGGWGSGSRIGRAVSLAFSSACVWTLATSEPTATSTNAEAELFPRALLPCMIACPRNPPSATGSSR